MHYLQPLQRILYHIFTGLKANILCLAAHQDQPGDTGAQFQTMMDMFFAHSLYDICLACPLLVGADFGKKQQLAFGAAHHRQLFGVVFTDYY